MTDRELMQQALDALDLVTDLTTHDDVLYEAIDALRARLSQPEPEPVAWVYPRFWDDLERVNCGTAYRNPTVDREPLYTAPPQREWQGLTTAERKALWNVTKKPSEFAELIEAKLREKNERFG